MRLTNNTLFKRLALTACLVMPSMASLAQQSLANATVTGSLCVGLDCVKGEKFDDDQLRLKENNLRIRFINTTITNTKQSSQQGESVLGESWNVEANASANGGPAYFDFQLKSTTKDNLLSDGTAKAYDCDDIAQTVYPANQVPVLGSVPYGDPVFTVEIVASSCEFDAGLKCLHQCIANTNPKHTAVSVMTLGAAGTDTAYNNSIALGYNPDFSYIPAPNTVSLGTDELKRKLVHLADAMQASDALNVRSLQFPRLSHVASQLAELQRQVTQLEAQVDEYIDNLPIDVAPPVEGGTTSLDLTTHIRMTIENPSDDNPYGPRSVAFGFSSDDGKTLDGVTVLLPDGSEYALSGWWQQINIDLDGPVTEIVLPKQADRKVLLQWWYGW